MHLDTQVEAHLEIPQPVCPALSPSVPLSVWEKKIITCPSSTSQSTDLGIESREWEWICFCNWTAVFLFHLLQMCCTVYIPIHFKVLMAKLHWTCFGNGPFLMHLNTSVSQMPTLFVPLYGSPSVLLFSMCPSISPVRPLSSSTLSFCFGRRGRIWNGSLLVFYLLTFLNGH